VNGRVSLPHRECARFLCLVFPCDSVSRVWILLQASLAILVVARFICQFKVLCRPLESRNYCGSAIWSPAC